MIPPPGGTPIYLACGATDLRKSIDKLAALVQQVFRLDPCSQAWFVFWSFGDRLRNKRLFRSLVSN